MVIVRVELVKKSSQMSYTRSLFKSRDSFSRSLQREISHSFLNDPKTQSSLDVVFTHRVIYPLLKESIDRGIFVEVMWGLVRGIGASSWRSAGRVIIVVSGIIVISFDISSTSAPFIRTKCRAPRLVHSGTMGIFTHSNTDSHWTTSRNGNSTSLWMNYAKILDTMNR